MATGCRLRRNVPRRRDRDTSDADRRKIRLRAPRPVLVGHFDALEPNTASLRKRRQLAMRRITRGVVGEVHDPLRGIGDVILVNREQRIIREQPNDPIASGRGKF